MLGLSITAIGMRSLTECLEIFQILRAPMKLDYLELAIGSTCSIDDNYLSIPLILHDSCLYKNGVRSRLNPLHPKTWKTYSEFIANHNVLAVSIHPPLQRECTRQELETALSKIEKAVNVPVYLEVMPSSEYWCSSRETLVEHPLLVDVSHVLIWFRGNQELTQQTCLELLKANQVGEIHLSHNNGQSDTHNLIPEDVWFSNLIDNWSREYFVTFESLGVAYSAYERLDKQKTRDNIPIPIGWNQKIKANNIY